MLSIVHDIHSLQRQGYKLVAYVSLSRGYIDLEAHKVLETIQVTSWNEDEIAEYAYYENRNLLDEIMQALFACKVEFRLALD